MDKIIPAYKIPQYNKKKREKKTDCKVTTYHPKSLYSVSKKCGKMLLFVI